MALEGKGSHEGGGGTVREKVFADRWNNDVCDSWLVEDKVMDGFPGYTSWVSVIETECISSQDQPTFSHHTTPINMINWMHI